MAAALPIFTHVRDHFRELRRGRRGHRFLDRYEQTHREGRVAGIVERVVFFLVAAVCLAIALVLTVFPGPALPFFFFAGALLATESLTIARLMDSSEVRVRRIAVWARRRWRRLSWPLKILCVVCALAGSGLAMYVTWRFLA